MSEELYAFILISRRKDDRKNDWMRRHLSAHVRPYAGLSGCGVGERLFDARGVVVDPDSIDKRTRMLARSQIVVAEISVFDDVVWHAIEDASRMRKTILCVASAVSSAPERAAAVELLKATHPKLRFEDYLIEVEIEQVIRKFFLRELPCLAMV